MAKSAPAVAESGSPKPLVPIRGLSPNSAEKAKAQFGHDDSANLANEIACLAQSLSGSLELVVEADRERAAATFADFAFLAAIALDRIELCALELANRANGGAQ